MGNEFKPIATQEEFDEAIKDRLNRQSEKHSKEIADLNAKIGELEKSNGNSGEYEKQISDLESQLKELGEKVSGYDSQLAEKEAKIREFEKERIKAKVAHEVGLSLDAIGFLKGDDEESIKASAESLKNLVGAKVAPLAKTTPNVGDSTTEGYKALVSSLGPK